MRSRFPLTTATRPITDAHTISPPSRCGECWQHMEALEQVWAEGSPREPDP
ncbi:hypothetical protein [Streptacidiphilus neutrinimicus]|uniref:hypothetical protein n=1 Tax=Streptacidiphilus neutrinimicus TaxID=105420 RepID=UPI000A681ABE|nr:hypothetical protein [Streptacidiphilus neutrinimicus]